jgi:hypothetical protein
MKNCTKPLSDTNNKWHGRESFSRIQTETKDPLAGGHILVGQRQRDVQYGLSEGG